MKLLQGEYSDELPIPLSEFERAQLFRKVEAELDHQRRHPRLRKWLLALAAVALAAGAALLSRSPLFAAAHDPDAEAMRTLAASHETIELPDGSRAFITGTSRLRIDAAEAERVRLTLLDGEASFEVTELERRSFIVAAADVDIDVLAGRTTINVRPGEGSVEVRVREGRADVHRESGGPPVVLKPGELWSRSRWLTPALDP